MAKSKNVLCNKYNDVALLVGRVLVAAIFIMAGFGKIMGFSGTAGYMASAGLPLTSFLLVLVILLQVGGGISLLLGYKTRLMSFLFSGFLILAIIFFHLGDMRAVNSHLMIFAGLLYMSASSPGRFSLDGYLSKK